MLRWPVLTCLTCRPSAPASVPWWPAVSVAWRFRPLFHARAGGRLHSVSKLPAASLPPSLQGVPAARLFPEVFACDPHHQGFARGGRIVAQDALGQIDPVTYGRDRSQLDGHVSRLSPYLRHGVLTLSEVRDAADRKSVV